MNGQLRRILVTIRDLGRPPASLLRKAATLARATGASIELLHVLTEPLLIQQAPRPGSAETPADEAAANRRLERLARSPIFEDIDVSCFVVRDYPVHEAIVRRARAIRADLVISGTHRKGFGERLLLRNTDWELIRHCPCPLLIVKSKRDYDRPKIIAAVDPFHTHAKPAALDARLLEAGNMLARSLRGELHAFHAYMPLATGTYLPAEVTELHAAQIRRAFADLGKKAGIAPARRHLRLGETSTQLNRTVKDLGASIVVMGAVSRSALKRLLIGSTAERVLDELTCDVLIVKPRDFETQVGTRPQALTYRIA